MPSSPKPRLVLLPSYGEWTVFNLLVGAFLSTCITSEIAMIGLGMIAGSMLCLGAFIAKKSGWKRMSMVLFLLNFGACGLTSVVGSWSLSGGGMAHLIRKSSEGASQGNAKALRATLARYRDDHGGAYPRELGALTQDSNYMNSIPAAKTPHYHADSSTVRYGAQADDAGGWLYDPKRIEIDMVLRVNCTHTDSKGKIWTSY